jgi:hypothetical protein
VTDSNDAPPKKPSALRDVSGTTIALTSLAVMAAAAVVSAPVWFYYRSKRKRTDALVSQAHGDVPQDRAAEVSPSAPAADAPTTPGATPE